MLRSGLLIAFAVVLLCSSTVQADTSAIADYIRTRAYCELSTSNTIGSIEANDIDKASGLIPSIYAGLVVWADGRSGRIAIMGYDLTDPNNIVAPSKGEFLISNETDGWQENNPFAGYSSVGGYRYVVYDAVDVSSPTGDLGNIQGSRATPAPTWLVQNPLRQQTPVLTNVTSSQTVLAWIHQPGTVSDLDDYPNTDIYAGTLTSPVTSPVPGMTNLTAGMAAPRDHLAADGRRLAWQELRYDESADVKSWDLVVYDLGGTYADPNLRFRYVNGTDSTKNQITPDLSGNLLAWAQEEDPSGTGATNIYFQDLASSVGPMAVTTTGTAANPAISTFQALTSDGNEVMTLIDVAFLVWQDHRGDGNTMSFFAGGNGETDYNWDIWAQELRITVGEWALYKDAFLIPADTLGRQTNPDIYGLDVCWQSQDPGVEDIYVWGPLAVPEPGTILFLAAGAVLLCRGRRKSGKGK